MNDLPTLAAGQHDAAAMQRLADNCLSSAAALTITDDDMYALAGAELVRIKKASSDLEAKRKTFTDPIHRLKVALADLFRKPEQDIAMAEMTIKRAMADYSDLKRREQEEARKKAEAAANEAAAMARRQAEELAAKAERARSAAKREEFLAAAEEAQEKAFLAETAPVRVEEAPKATGVSTRQQWVVASIDIVELVKAAAADPQYLAYLLPDEKKLGAMARAASGTLSIPGVRFRPETIIAASRRG